MNQDQSKSQVHSLRAVQDEKPYRIHLRLQKDGSGIFILNAATVLQLGPVSADFAYHFIKGTAPEDAAKQMAQHHGMDEKTALDGFSIFMERIHSLISTPDLAPASFFDFDPARPHSVESTLRLDCAITYRLPENTKADYAPVKRVKKELSTDEWMTVMDKAWQAGIPHIIFTGGEATLRDDLPELIAHAERNGQVCGLLTDGMKLLDKNYLDMLLNTGLDHILLLLHPDEPRSWKAIETVVPKDIFLTVHLTLNRENISRAAEILQHAAYLAVENISLSAAEDSLLDEMLELQNTVRSLRLNLHWDLPVPYSAFHPVSIETVDDTVPHGAGKTWLYVEPDGDVLPAQGEPDKALGNLLRDSWDQIKRS